MQKQAFYAIIAVVVIVVTAASIYVLYFMPPNTTTTTSSTTTSTTTTTSSTTTSTTATTTITLIAKDTRFNATNPTIHLKVGQTVKFIIINQESGSMPHSLYIKEIPSASTSTITPGQTANFTVTFSTGGNYTYACAVHPGIMDGKIVVQE